MIYLKKLIVVGDPGVGKTSLIKNFISKRFIADYRASIGVSIYNKNFKLDSNQSISFQIWDIAGQERWINMRHIYYRESHGVFVVGDLTRQNSFNQIEDFWIPDIKKYCHDIPIFLIANKSDLNFNVSKEFIYDLGKKIKSNEIIFTSAKSGANVEKSFSLISKYILESR